MIKIILNVIKYISSNPSNKGQKLYRYFLAVCWQLYKRVVGLPIISKLDNGKLFVLYPNSTCGSACVYVKIYDAEYIIFLRSNLEPGGILLDIGAHMGIYTLLLAECFETAHCFEPSEDTFNALENNLFLNKLTNFKANKVAVSDETKMVRFVTEGTYSGTNKIEGDTGLNSIQAVCIDDYIQSNNLNPGEITFVKIDTEGHEFSVLKGMKKLLDVNKKMLILMESYDYEEAANYFESLGYYMFVIDDKGRISTDSTSILGSGNYFAVGCNNPLYNKIFVSKT